MCLAVPMKLIQFEGVNGVVESDGVIIDVNIMLIEEPKIGDYLIIHAGFAIQHLDEKEAQETLDLFREMEKFR